MTNESKEIFPVRWRAQTLKDDIILIRVYDKENQMYDINFPLKQIVQINKILKEIIGYSEKKTFFETNWTETIYKLDQKKTNIELLSNEDKSSFSLSFQNSSGIKINFEMVAQDLRDFSKKINEVIDK